MRRAANLQWSERESLPVVVRYSLNIRNQISHLVGGSGPDSRNGTLRIALLEFDTGVETGNLGTSEFVSDIVLELLELFVPAGVMFELLVNIEEEVKEDLFCSDLSLSVLDFLEAMILWYW